MGCKQKSAILGLEVFFAWYGRQVASRPVLFAIGGLTIFAAMSLGLLNYREESNPYSLWIPPDSDFVRDSEWLAANFPSDVRFHSVIVTADDVLTPQVMHLLLAIHKSVDGISNTRPTGWQDKCLRIPVINLLLAIFPPSTHHVNDTEDVEEEEIDLADDSPGNTSNFTISLEEFQTTLQAFRKSFLNISSQEQEKGLSRKKRFLDFSNPSVKLYPDSYCDLVERVSEMRCFETSLLEIWATDNYGWWTDEVVTDLDKKDIVYMINNAHFSQTLRRDTDYESYLGGIDRDDEGKIVSAKATSMTFVGKVNVSAISPEDRQAQGKGQPADRDTLEFETSLMQAINEVTTNLTDDIQVHINVARSFQDLTDESIEGDVVMFIFGFGLVFGYVQVMLGKFNCIEQRPLLSLIGIGLIALTVVATYGLCSVIGLRFSPMHNIIPFLFLGIGIDDMFVIVQNFDELPAESRTTAIPSRISMAMRNAGVAITLTSLTDIIVFAVGASTVLPALRSFCIYCAVGIFLLYVVQSTVFVAALTKDVQRIDEGRNAFLVCVKGEVGKGQNASTLSMSTLFRRLASVLCKLPAQLSVLLVSAALLAVGAWGLARLRQEFNPVWFLPNDSGLKGWYDANQGFFPSKGEEVNVHVVEFDPVVDLVTLDELANELLAMTSVVTEVDAWVVEFRAYLQDNHLVDEEEDALMYLQGNLTAFRWRLTQFLFSPDGARFQHNFHFDQQLVCGGLAPDIKMTTMRIVHPVFSGPSEHIPAMNAVKSAVKRANFSGSISAFPLSLEYASWETDEVITYETVRNLCLSVVCVFATTWLLISKLRASLCILGCVLKTLIEVSGLMHFWGLTIDVISCVNLVISVGLCVDYSAHIVHAFLAVSGSRQDRVEAALARIGPAVLNGGLSTALAFILTAFSTSHVFLTFFKIFFLVVLLGLFNSLVFLPVVLSLLGPQSADIYHGEGAVQVLSVKKLSPQDNLAFET